MTLDTMTIYSIYTHKLCSRQSITFIVNKLSKFLDKSINYKLQTNSWLVLDTNNCKGTSVIDGLTLKRDNLVNQAVF